MGKTPHVENKSLQNMSHVSSSWLKRNIDRNLAEIIYGNYQLILNSDLVNLGFCRGLAGSSLVQDLSIVFILSLGRNYKFN